jgi:DNA-binding winged helix-turn-helix (wHTH) protein
MHARYVTDLLSNMHDQILPLLPDSLQHIVALGAAIAEGEHRPDVLWAMLDYREQPKWPPSVKLSWKAPATTQQPTEPWHFWKFFERGELEAPANWLLEVRARWKDCGLPDWSIIKLAANPIPRTEVGEQTQRIERAFAAAVHAAKITAIHQPPKPGFLGLILNEQAGELRRYGYDLVESLTPRKIAILKLLLKNKEDLTSRNMLLKLWNTDGSGVIPENGTIDNELSELRHKLAPFHVRTKNRRKLGWTLEETEHSRKSPARSPNRVKKGRHTSRRSRS